jgi:hypothetical protein
MDMKDPVRSVNGALTHALEQGLAGLPSPLADALLGRLGDAAIEIRPTVEQCEVVMFPQAWSSHELGYDARRNACSIDAETVIVTGPGGDACVYVFGQLLYRVARPNRRFFLDVTGQRMRARNESACYEGRDTPDEEAFDYEAAAALARVCGAARRFDPGAAAQVVRMLRVRLSEFEETATAAFEA